jgi:hypothetical protein
MRPILSIIINGNRGRGRGSDKGSGIALKGVADFGLSNQHINLSLHLS